MIINNLINKISNYLESKDLDILLKSKKILDLEVNTQNLLIDKIIPNRKIKNNKVNISEFRDGISKSIKINKDTNITIDISKIDFESDYSLDVLLKIPSVLDKLNPYVSYDYRIFTSNKFILGIINNRIFLEIDGKKFLSNRSVQINQWSKVTLVSIEGEKDLFINGVSIALVEDNTEFLGYKNVQTGELKISLNNKTTEGYIKLNNICIYKGTIHFLLDEQFNEISLLNDNILDIEENIVKTTKEYYLVPFPIGKYDECIMDPILKLMSTKNINSYNKHIRKHNYNINKIRIESLDKGENKEVKIMEI